MRYSLFSVDRSDSSTLQSQIREMLVSAILSGQLAENTPVPSTRALAKRLKVSRNTVMLAYQALAADGYLITRERSGFYVSPEVMENLGQLRESLTPQEQVPGDRVDWAAKLRLTPSTQFNILKTENWHSYPYPFIYGQVDPTLFPISAWRDCVRQTMSIKWLDAWTDDRFTADDPMLIEQIQRRILIRRGVIADPDEILVTMGAQNALFLIAHLLVKPDTPVALEDPGYPDVRNIMQLRSTDIRAIPVDEQGICADMLGDAKLVYVTPSHQFPTNTTMTMERRREVLEWAAKADALIIEDDYEYETNYRGQPTAALRSIDASGRVLYVGSLSKSIMPGLRIGFIVAPKPVIKEIRAMRRLMLRHPPGNNQRSVALFLAQGSQDALISKLHHAYSNRWNTLSEAMETHFPGWAQVSAFGGSSFWVSGPPDLDARELAKEALTRGVLIEPGDVFFTRPAQGMSYFRLGFSSIHAEKIEKGIEFLAESYENLSKRRLKREKESPDFV